MGETKDWLLESRSKAAALLDKNPQPQPYDEEWKYTSLSGVTFDVASSELALKVDGSHITDMLSALEKQNTLLKRKLNKLVEKKGAHVPLLALNAAKWTNGYFIHVPKGKDAGVQRVHVALGSQAATRSIIIAEPGSRVEVIEKYTSAPSAFHVGVVEIYAGPNSQVTVHTLQNVAATANNFQYVRADVGQDATVNFQVGLLGGAVGVHNMKTTFDAEGGTSETRGIYFVNGKQHVTVTTNAHHVAKHTTSKISLRGVLADAASSVHRGLIRIEKSGAQTDAYLASHALKLSKEAKASSVPSLEIENNDVRAAHAATVGNVDEDKIFYLMSRGLTRGDAEAVIVEGFLESVITNMHESLVEEIHTIIKSRIAQTAQGVAA